MCRNVVGGDYWGVYKRGDGRAEMDRPIIQAVHSNPLTDVNIALHQHRTLITKKTKLSSYIRKFRWDRVQSHIWERAQISIYSMRRLLVKYDFTPYLDFHEKIFVYQCIVYMYFFPSSEIHPWMQRQTEKNRDRRRG
jgi:hypothetical protein